MDERVRGRILTLQVRGVKPVGDSHLKAKAG